LHNEKSFAYWNENIVKRNYKIQKEILKNVIPLLEEWWELVYSTCTINPFENEDIVHFVLCNFPEMKLQDIKLDFEFSRPWILKFENKSFKKELYKTVRILPSAINEWFFVAKFKK
jgi:16S rRNA C967 or C1407 C5-methylase (RsmB/RsmF family)